MKLVTQELIDWLADELYGVGIKVTAVHVGYQDAKGLDIKRGVLEVNSELMPIEVSHALDHFLGFELDDADGDVPEDGEGPEGEE